MQVKSLRSDLEKYLKRRGLIRKFEKQRQLIETDFRHSSLHTEILEPKHLKIYPFRIDNKYRAVFVLVDSDTIEIVDINDHYR